MPDERLSDGEIRRSLDRIDRRIDDLAKSAVPVDAWTRENGHLRAAATDADDHCKTRHDATVRAIDEADKRCQTRHGGAMTAIEKIEKRGQLTVGRLIAILAILATLLTGWWAAIGAAKGIH